jgi:molybdopterin/thiamine biosynthesis adenylyltransferase
MSRYTQQILVEELGIGGQIKISNAKVLIVGAGGLGTPVATYLAACGVGTVGVIDGDKISESNLHRQFLYNPVDTTHYKSETLSNRIISQNPEIKVINYTEFLNNDNALSIIKDWDIICDCTDNLQARLLLDETCSTLSIPLIYAAVRGWEGYLTILNFKNKIRLTQIFSIESLKDESENNCNVSGIVGMTCGVLGSLQANEVLKIILDQKSLLDGEILCINTLSNSFRKFKLKGDLAVD